MALSQEVKAKVLVLAKENKSLRQIAASLGIGKSTVSAILKNAKTIEDNSNNDANNNNDEKNSTTIEEKMDAADYLDSLVPDSKNPVVAAGLPDSVLEAFMVDKPKKRASKKNVMSFNLLEDVKEEKKEDKGTLISKLTMNVQNFEVVLKDLIKGDPETFLKSLHSKSVSELESTLKMFEHTRSSNNMANQLKYGVFATANAIEGLTKRVFKLKTDGYADMIKAQEAELLSILREMAMDSSFDNIKKYQTPSVRLATLMATTLMAVDTRNRMNTINVPSPIAKPEAAFAKIDKEKYSNL